MKEIICLGLLLSAPAAGNAARPVPQFELQIKPINLEEPRFVVSGSIQYCADTGEKVFFYVPKGSAFNFTRNGAAIDVASKKGVDWPCDRSDPESAPITFEGTSPTITGKCGASHQEIYCRNNSIPNPEVLAPWSRYRIQFDLPEGYDALSPDPSIQLNNGIEFQIAEFSPPQFRETERMMFEYRFPKGFSPEKKYLDFIEATLERYLDRFGALPFQKLKVGAIRRGEDTGEISGSPAGNLILFSRSTFAGNTSGANLGSIGIHRDASDALRKLVIAHELSHFWFGTNFTGKDGWMVEGIPNYLGLVAVGKDSAEDYADIRKYFKYMAAQGPKDAIADQPFGGGPLYFKAYFQGPLALAELGEVVGHDEIVELITGVYQKNNNPSFVDFDRAFKQVFPSQSALWDRSWRITASPQ